MLAYFYSVFAYTQYIQTSQFVLQLVTARNQIIHIIKIALPFFWKPKVNYTVWNLFFHHLTFIAIISVI